MSLTDNLANMLKDIFCDDFEIFQGYNNMTSLICIIIGTSRGLHELIRGEMVDGL